MFNASFYHNQKILQQKTGPMTIETDFFLHNSLSANSHELADGYKSNERFFIT